MSGFLSLLFLDLLIDLVLLVLLMEWVVSLINFFVHAKIADEREEAADGEEEDDYGEDGESILVRVDCVAP